MTGKKVAFLLLALVLSVGAQALRVGDYRTAASGNWSQSTIWRVCSSVDPLLWSAATDHPNDPEVSVYLQHAVSLNLLGIQVKDLQFMVNNNTSFGSLILGYNTITIHGIISRFSGNAPGLLLPETDAYQPHLVRATATGTGEPMGSLRFVGQGRRLSNSWNFLGFEGNESSYPKLEIDMDSNSDVALWDQRNRFRKVHVVKGVLSSTWTLRIAQGNLGGDLIVDAGAAFESNITPGTQYNVEVFCSFANSPIRLLDLDGSLRLLAENSILLMSSSSIAGTSSIEYLGGNQNLAGGDSFTYCYNLVLGGTGIKSLSQDINIFESLTMTGDARLARNGFNLFYDTDASLIYRYANPRHSSGQEWLEPGPKNVVVDCDLNLHEARTVRGDLILLSRRFELESLSLNVMGTLRELGGSYNGGTGFINGFDSAEGRFMQVEQNENYVYFPSYSMRTEPLYPQMVNRQWEINGFFSGQKEVSLYWLPEDDGNYPWTDLDPPVLYVNGVEEAGTTWGLDASGRRWLKTVVWDNFENPGLWTIGRLEVQTLPLELASFTAVATSQNSVRISWVTHSETALTGYIIYRSEEDFLGNAWQVSPLIPAVNSSGQSSYSFTDNEAEAGIYWHYWLAASQMDGTVQSYGPVISYSPVAPDDEEQVTRPALRAVYPNPIRDCLRLKYDRMDGDATGLRIYNQRGQLVRSMDISGGTGSFTAVWNGRDEAGRELPSGIYYLSFEAREQRQSRRIMLLRP